jgi:hypothetical protein
VYENKGGNKIMGREKFREGNLLYLNNDNAQSITIKELDDDVAGVIELSDYDDTKAEFEFDVIQATKIFYAMDDFLRRHVSDWEEVRDEEIDIDDFDDDDDDDTESVFTEEENELMKTSPIDFLELYFKKKGISLRDKESKLIFENGKFIEINNKE